MRAHQKYFSILDANGKLAPRFVVVANLEATDGGKAIVNGNERVLRARLADAKFFWNQDRKTSLDARSPALEKIIFHAKLGSLSERVNRIETSAGAVMAAAIAETENLPAPEAGTIADQAVQAAKLAKADLATGMVGEFPELQGIMGRYYALADGEPAAVAEAIAEHYSPLGPNDKCPTAPVSVAVALADKLDTLVGFFAIDEKPTGSKDPYALRRAALGIIRLILQNGVRLSLREAITHSLRSYANELLDAVDEDAVFNGLMDFFKDRLKVHLRADGVLHDHIDAVFASKEDDDLVRIVARVRALGTFLGGEDGANLLVAYKRASNIVRDEEKKDGKNYTDWPDRSVFSAPEEIQLHEQLDGCADAISRAIHGEEYSVAMSALAKLRNPIDVFFENVIVNVSDEEMRKNRLYLLSRFNWALEKVADFSKIEG
jgi:glycyl-tRNA synthetase beta chain